MCKFDGRRLPPAISRRELARSRPNRRGCCAHNGLVGIGPARLPALDGALEIPVETVQPLGLW